MQLIMFSDTPIIYNFNQYLNPKTQTNPLYKEDPNAIGLMWEIPLKDTEEDSSYRQLKKVVSIIVLPTNKGTHKEAEDITSIIYKMSSKIRFKEIITDYNANSNLKKFGKESLPFLQTIKNELTLCKMICKEQLEDEDLFPHLFLLKKMKGPDIIHRILEDEKLKKPFFDLGKKIYNKIKNEKNSYFFYISSGLLPEKIILKEILKSRWAHLKKSNDFNIIENNFNISKNKENIKAEFYLEMIDLLDLCYDEQAGLGLFNLKDIVFESICNMKETIEYTYKQYDSAEILHDPKFIEKIRENDNLWFM